MVEIVLPSKVHLQKFVCEHYLNVFCFTPGCSRLVTTHGFWHSSNKCGWNRSCPMSTASIRHSRISTQARSKLSVASHQRKTRRFIEVCHSGTWPVVNISCCCQAQQHIVYEVPWHCMNMLHWCWLVCDVASTGTHNGRAIIQMYCNPPSSMMEGCLC